MKGAQKYDNILMTLLRKIWNGLRPEGEMAKSRGSVTASNNAAGVVANLIGGNFFTGFLLLMKADDAFMGLITMVTLIGNLLQVLSPLLLERFHKRKGILIAGRGVIYLLNVVIIGIIPYLSFTNRTGLMLVLSVTLLVNLFNAILAPGYAVWQIKSIPESMRAGYYSFFNIISGVTVYTVILAASKMVDFYKASGKEMEGLFILRAVSILICAVDIFFLFRIKEYPNPKPDGEVNIISVLVSPFKERKYLVTVAISCLWTFSAYIPGPYYSIYLLKDLKVGYSYLNIINMLNIPILILLTPVWARMIQTTSWFKTLCFSMGIFLVNYIGSAFVTRDTMILYPVFAVLSFLVAPGINLALSNIPYINIPEGNQTNYIGFYSTMNYLAALIGVTIGKEFIKYTEGFELRLFGIAMQNKQYILLLTAVIMLASVVVIYILQKDESSDFKVVRDYRAI